MFRLVEPTRFIKRYIPQMTPSKRSDSISKGKSQVLTIATGMECLARIQFEADGKY